VVAQNGSTPVTFTHNGPNNDTCSLVCHGHTHTGSTTSAVVSRHAPIRIK
jgi:hypothetical protein